MALLAISLWGGEAAQTPIPMHPLRAPEGSSRGVLGAGAALMAVMSSTFT